MLCGVVALGCAFPAMQAKAQGSPSLDSLHTETAVDRVASAFKNGDADPLFGVTAERIDLNLLGSRSYYSRSQASYVLRDFFRHHRPTDFVIERSVEADASLFVMGVFHHDRADRPAQVMVRFEQGAESWVLHELRIEADHP